MDRNQIKRLMDNIYTSNEAAEYLNISTQRLNQLVHDKKIEPIKVSKSIMLFLKSDLKKRKISNVTNNKVEKSEGLFNINIPYVRDAILYYTIQQYFNNNDKKTEEYIKIIENTHSFNYRSGLEINIPLLSSLLGVTKNEFYTCYKLVKESFSKLTEDVILIKKGDEAYSKLLESTNEAPPYLFLKGNIHLLNEKSV